MENIENRTSERLRRAIERFDAENAQDPTRTSEDGVEAPEAVLYARRMTAWLERLAPDAEEAVRLAVRSQHIRRWEVPRSSYPMTRAGYHQWRTAAARFHAEVAGRILRDVGYDEAMVTRVQSLLRKERLKEDPGAQLLEDVACLVFLERTFAPFAAAHEDEKVTEILRRTWRKMSDRGRAAAGGLVDALPERARALVRRALSEEAS